MTAANYDSSQQVFSTGGFSSLTTPNWTISGTNRCLWHSLFSGAGAPVHSSGSKWQGSSGTTLTQIGSDVAVGLYWYHALYRLIAPTAGTNTSYASWAAGADETLLVCMSSQDTDQTTPNGTVATGTGTSTSPSVNVSTTTGELCFDFIGNGDDNGSAPTLTVGGNQTSRQEIEGASTTYEALGCSTSTAASSSEAMNWTLTGSSPNWSMFAFQVNGLSGGGATQNITLNGYAAPGIYGSAASAPGAVGVSPSGYSARGIYGAAAAAPGAVNIALNGLVAQGIYGALTANSTYPVTLNPVVAQAIFGSDTVAPGAANIAPSSVVGQAIFGAISAAMGSTQDIQPASVVGQGVSGSFTLVPGAVSLSLGDTVARGVSGSFSLAPGAVGLSLTGYAAKGAYGPLTMSFNINMNSIVAQASIGGMAVAVGPVTVLPNSLVAQSEFGPLVVTIPGGTAALIAQSQLFIGMGIRI